ncbi:Pentatricopeptide repeat-containing protein [Abeliophyllum distichum]|uniref:Pentatricopeptide repeat-containing protein n=1 Tax=Abeliophyllum distichum TaxID=126358 RepID=A0ABD1VVZ3_9LAMI
MLFSEMVQKGYDKCVVAYSSMVSMYSKTGRPRDAMRIVAKMKEGLRTECVDIQFSIGYARESVKLETSREELEGDEMKKSFPDRVTYTSVISAYSRAREFEMCTKLFDGFKIKGGVIDRAMAGIMVVVFSKMNRVDELVKLLQDMNFIAEYMVLMLTYWVLTSSQIPIDDDETNSISRKTAEASQGC